MTSPKLYNICPVVQLYIPNCDMYNEYVKIIFESSYTTIFRLLRDEKSKYFFCKASELKSSYPSAFIVAIITNPFNRMFIHYKEYQKTNGSELTFTKFILKQTSERTLFDCSDYIDTDIDFIIRAENFRHDFIKFLNLIDLNNRVQVLPKFPSLIVPTFYTSENKKIIKKIFEKDIDRYYKDFDYA